jgi:hypothetical protein
VSERGLLLADQDESYRRAAPIDRVNVLEILTTDIVSSAEVELSPAERADFQRDNLLYAEHWLIRAHLANGSSRVIARSCAPRGDVEKVNIDIRMAFVEQRPRDGWKRFELSAAERKEAWLGPFAELGSPRAIAAARPRVKVGRHAGFPVVWWIEERLDGPLLTYWENSISVSIRDGKALLDRTSWNIAVSPVDLMGTESDFDDVDKFSTDRSVLRKAASKYDGGKAHSGRQVALVYKAGNGRLVVDSTDVSLDAGALCKTLNEEFFAKQPRGGWFANSTTARVASSEAWARQHSAMLKPESGVVPHVSAEGERFSVSGWRQKDGTPVVQWQQMTLDGKLPLVTHQMFRAADGIVVLGRLLGEEEESRDVMGPLGEIVIETAARRSRRDGEPVDRKLDHCSWLWLLGSTADAPRLAYFSQIPRDELVRIAEIIRSEFLPDGKPVRVELE